MTVQTTTTTIVRMLDNIESVVSVRAGVVSTDRVLPDAVTGVLHEMDSERMLRLWWIGAVVSLFACDRGSQSCKDAVNHARASLDISLDEAAGHVRRAMDLGYPLPGLALNYLACIAKAQGDIVGMMDRFSEAAKVDPQHFVLIKNVQAARAWFAAGGPGKGAPLTLEARHDFQLLERTVQPTLPGPLPERYAEWETAAVGPRAADAFVRTPEVEGSRSALQPRGKLKVLAGQ